MPATDQCRVHRLGTAATGGIESVTRARAYVCPMCPDVREDGPAACPKCGMALELEAPTISTRTQYTCPMHPEVIRDEPGDCPICGMVLEATTERMESSTQKFTIEVKQ